MASKSFVICSLCGRRVRPDKIERHKAAHRPMATCPHCGRRVQRLNVHLKNCRVYEALPAPPPPVAMNGDIAEDMLFAFVFPGGSVPRGKLAKVAQWITLTNELLEES